MPELFHLDRQQLEHFRRDLQQFPSDISRQV